MESLNLIKNDPWLAPYKEAIEGRYQYVIDQEKSLTGTLRGILDIPAAVKGSITFKDSYDDQRPLDGFSGKTVDVDKELTFTLKPFEVLVYEGGKVK